MVYITVYGQCPECNADRERGFVSVGPWRYDHVAAYLAYVRPRIAAIRAGENSVDARIWQRQFRVALDRRITLKTERQTGRKYADGYLERLRGMSHVHDESYLRNFAAKGASAL